MKRLEYKTPEIEVINIELEGAIMDTISGFSLPGAETTTTSSKSSAIKSSYSMDDYSWK